MLGVLLTLPPTYLPVQDGEKLHLNCIWPCETIILKKKLQAFVGIRADNQRLVYCGRILKDDEVIPEEVRRGWREER